MSRKLSIDEKMNRQMRRDRARVNAGLIIFIVCAGIAILAIATVFVHHLLTSQYNSF